MNDRAIEMTVTHMQTLDRVGMSQEDIAHYAYDFVLSLLYGEYPSYMTTISAHTRIKAVDILEKAHQVIEVEKRNETYLWQEIVRKCETTPDGAWRYNTRDEHGRFMLTPLDAQTIKALAEWKRKGWITYEYTDGTHRVSIVKEEQL